MKRTQRHLSRLPIRLLAFNLLLVFLPVAGVLFLGEYEERLESAEVRSMTDQARLIAAAIANDERIDTARFEQIVRRAKVTDVRVRLVDATGRVVGDSERFLPPKPQQPRTDRHNLLYRIGVFLVRPLVRIVRPPEEPLQVDFYDNAERLGGTEIVTALRGREGFDKKISAPGERSVTLYRTVPVPWGAVVASKSTFSILQDLYAVRLRVMRIFVASVIVAILLSIFISTTIVRPLRLLRVEARAILDRRNRLRGHFRTSTRLDEIGDLSRALERIMRRLDAHLGLVETFASDVSHELKNPLASIRNANEMLAEIGNPADRRRFVRIIEQEVARMERLISGVREISVIDAELVREERMPIDLGALLSKIVEGFQIREGERIRFELQVPEAPVVVSGSEDRFIQVFENVLDNAVSFSPPGCAVQIDVTTEEGSAVTRICDQGPGIPESTRGRIFDRFFTFRPDSGPSDGHTGLGLAIVKAIVQGYGGNIHVANADRGAVFTIRLPRTA
ncbi:MAG TPA: ATP-binding protein [Thermoanaerobaculia bacterium]